MSFSRHPRVFLVIPAQAGIQAIDARSHFRTSYYESQSDEEAVAEDEAALPDPAIGTVINVPNELLPEIRELIARHKKSA